MFAPASRVAAAKRAGGVDSLRVRKAGYLDFAREIASYTAGNLGDLVLVPAPDDGSICAKQRMVQTSEGAEITLCEALFARLQPLLGRPRFPEFLEQVFEGHFAEVLVGGVVIRR